jgi:hypothetical protein
MVVQMNRLISLTIPKPWLETVLTLGLTLFLSRHRPGRGLKSSNADQMIRAPSGFAPDVMSSTSLTLLAEVDPCVVSVELYDLGSCLILDLRQDGD